MVSTTDVKHDAECLENNTRVMSSRQWTSIRNSTQQEMTIVD